MQNKYNRGVRFTAIDYSKVVTHRRLFGAAGFNWQDLGINDLSNPVNLNLPSQRFQPADGTSCIEHSGATAVEGETSKVASAQPAYRGVGTVGEGTDVNDFVAWMQAQGICLESVSPSNNLEDQALKNAPMPAILNFKGVQPVFINPQDSDVMDQIAEATAAKHGVLILLGSNETEYDQTSYTPKYIPGTTIEFHHCICGQRGGLISMAQRIVCRDSAGRWSSPNGVRYLSQSFIQAPGHCLGIVYFTSITDTTPALSSTSTTEKDPTGTFPNMTPETAGWWQRFWWFLMGRTLSISTTGMETTPTYDLSGSYVAIAGLVVAGLSSIGFIVDTNTIVTILAGAVALVGVIKQIIAHRKLAKATAAAGVKVSGLK